VSSNHFRSILHRSRRTGVRSDRGRTKGTVKWTSSGTSLPIFFWSLNFTVTVPRTHCREVSRVIFPRPRRFLVQSLIHPWSQVSGKRRDVSRPPRTLDGKTGLLTGLLTGIQGWKCPVALSQTCCGSKSLKVILMDSNFGGHPVLKPVVTL